MHSKYSIGKLRKTWKQRGNAKETTGMYSIWFWLIKAVHCVHVP